MGNGQTANRPILAGREIITQFVLKSFPRVAISAH